MWQLGRELPPGTEHCRPWPWTTHPPELWENKRLCHLIYGILLQQPELRQLPTPCLYFRCQGQSSCISPQPIGFKHRYWFLSNTRKLVMNNHSLGAVCSEENLGCIIRSDPGRIMTCITLVCSSLKWENKTPVPTLHQDILSVVYTRYRVLSTMTLQTEIHINTTSFFFSLQMNKWDTQRWTDFPLRIRLAKENS